MDTGYTCAEEVVPNTIEMTKGAYAKADMIGPLIEGMTERDLEWSGFMLAQKGSHLVRDILLEHDQDISRGNVTISGASVAAAGARVKELGRQRGQELYVIGWIHGHGTCMLSPSDTDLGNFSTVLNSVSLNTEQNVDAALHIIESEPQIACLDDRLVYSGSAQADGRVEYHVKDAAALRKLIVNADGVPAGTLLERVLGQVDTRYIQPTIVGFAYFVIVNNPHDTPYTAVAFRSEKAITRTEREGLVERLPLRLVEVPDDIVVKKEAVEEEIRANVKMPERPSLIVRIMPKKKEQQPSSQTLDGLARELKKHPLGTDVARLADALDKLGRAHTYPEQVKIVQQYLQHG